MTHLPNRLPTYLHTYLPTYLPTYVVNFLLQVEVLLSESELGFRLQNGPRRTLVLLHHEHRQRDNHLQQVWVGLAVISARDTTTAFKIDTLLLVSCILFRCFFR